MQEKIRSRYTMEEERLMFEAIMQGQDGQAGPGAVYPGDGREEA
jgi:hypothetical protein